MEVSSNIEETALIAKIFLEKILKNKNRQRGALVVSLSGELGVGKTAFVQAVGKYLGIKNKITSPTFVIMKKYPIAEQARYGAGPIKNIKCKFLLHFDAYRLKRKEELLRLGWKEIINNKEHLVFIEWPENVAKIIPSHAKRVCISINDNGHRSFELK